MLGRQYHQCHSISQPDVKSVHGNILNGRHLIDVPSNFARVVAMDA